MDEASGIPYVISKPDISAYEIDHSPSPTPSHQDGSVDGMEAAAGVLDNYQMAQDISQFHSAFGEPTDRVPNDMLSLQDVAVEIGDQDANEPLDVKPQILMEPSSSSKTGGTTKKKFKKTLMKDIFETVKAAQMEACTKMTETFQEMEEKRMQLELEMEERRLAAEKEMMQTFLTTMQASMTQMMKTMRKPCCHSCHCNSKSDESKE